MQKYFYNQELLTLQDLQRDKNIKIGYMYQLKKNQLLCTNILRVSLKLIGPLNPDNLNNIYFKELGPSIA